MNQFRAGKLPAMLERAGYPPIAAALDRDLIATKLEKEVEPKATPPSPAGRGGKGPRVALAACAHRTPGSP
ncbi:MAG: DUF7700 domain-containing protein [Candidatus Entotheonellia bacterium]